MKEAYQKIWDIALAYQDKRDDEGHASTVYSYAVELCKILGGDEEIAIPAAILHDIGWSNVSEEERFYAVSPGKDRERDRQIRLVHEKEGARMAGEILRKIGYPEEKISKIQQIIDGHDTSKGFLSKEDGIVKDADKLWRYTKRHVEVASRRGHNIGQDYLDKYAKNIDEEGFFYSDEARKIARDLLEENRGYIMKREDAFKRLKDNKAIKELEFEKDLKKPWGGYITFARNIKCTTKVLFVEDELSLQAHKERAEEWFLASGSAVVYRGEMLPDIGEAIAGLKPTEMKPGDLISIPKNMIHTAVNMGEGPATIVEIQIGHADEEDIIRLYDKHGRVPNKDYPSGLSVEQLIKHCKERFHNKDKKRK